MGSDGIAIARQRVGAVTARRPASGLGADAPVTVRWDGGRRTVARSDDGVEVATDMPAEVGGDAAAPTPGWLLRTALASLAPATGWFQQLVGDPPMQYVAQRRRLLASPLLARSSVPLAWGAEEVGYQTDTAFSRAFRREFGLPRAAWRRRQAGAVSGAAATVPETRIHA